MFHDVRLGNHRAINSTLTRPRDAAPHDATHWFVDFRFEASKLPSWQPPSLFFGARRLHIWMRGWSTHITTPLCAWICLRTRGHDVVATYQSHGCNIILATQLFSNHGHLCAAITAWLQPFFLTLSAIGSQLVFQSIPEGAGWGGGQDPVQDSRVLPQKN